MQDEVVVRVLREAARIEGSTSALAGRLRAPETTLVRWMTGNAQMPLRAFLAAVEFVMQAENAAADAPPGGPPPAQKLVFPLGELLARCARCDGTEFTPGSPGAPLRLTSTLVCTACGEKVVHGRLLARLAQDAVHQSKAMAVRARRAVESSRERVARLKNGDGSGA